jgi:uncharacterized protein
MVFVMSAQNIVTHGPGASAENRADSRPVSGADADTDGTTETSTGARTARKTGAKPGNNADSGASAEGIAAAVKAASKTAGKKALPPVHLWNPPFCGDLDIHIKRDGTWFYLGTPIGRPELVRLFASVLRRDGAGYFLVTPVEKVGIKVDDVPFIAVDFDQDGEDLVFTTSLGDTARAGAEHPIRVEINARTGEPVPYVHIRADLEARIDRKSFYRLVDIGAHAPHDGDSWFGLRSGGRFFPIIASADLI